MFWILGSVLSLRATIHSRCCIVFNVHTSISYSILPFPSKRPYLPGKKAHRLNRTNDGESQQSNGLNKKNSSAGAAYFLVHFKVVVARLSRFPTDAAICSHAAPGHIFDRLKVRAFKGSVQRSNAKVRFKVPCEQSETIERFRVNKVAGQMFEPVENSAASRPLTSS